MSLRSLVQALRARQKPKDTIQYTRVEAVLPNRRVVVKGQAVPLSGLALPNVGDVVPVVFRGTKPILALQHRVRRAKAGWIRPGGDVIEELFVATDPATGKREIWFRNDKQVTMLDLRKVLPGDPEYVKWGSRGDAFFVRTSGHTYHIFSLDRPDPDRGLGAIGTSATLLRTDQPTTSNVRLTGIQTALGFRSDRVFVDIERITDAKTDSGQPGGGSQSVTATPRILTASSAADVLTEVRLTAGLFSGSNPIARIDDVALDDRRHLILVVNVDLARTLNPNVRVNGSHVRGSYAPYTDADGVPHASEHPAPYPQAANDLRATFSELRPITPFGPFAPFGSLVPFVDVADSTRVLFTTLSLVQTGRHLYVVDVTAGAVLWATTSAVPSVSSLQRWDEYWSYAQHLHQTSYDELGNPVVLDAYILHGFGDDACTQNPNLPTTPVTIDILRASNTKSIAATRPEVVALVGADADQFVTSGGSTTGGPESARLGGHFGDTFGQACLTITRRETTGQGTTQTYFHDYAGRYVPRRQKLNQQGEPDGTPLGVLYVGVRRVRLDDPTQGALAAFAVDLATSAVQPLLALAPSAVSPQAFGGTYVEFPQIILLSANAHHVLWRQRFGLDPDTERDAIELSAVTAIDSSALIAPTTREVLAVVNARYNPFADPAPAAKKPVVDFLTRNLTLLTPDFFYWAEDRADERGNVFVKGWDFKTKELTLPASAATAPPPDDDLERLGVLEGLPAGVTPQRAKGIPTLYGILDGNVSFVPGASFRVVNDEQVFSARGRFIEEPEPTS